jgi:hypothetical protein
MRHEWANAVDRCVSVLQTDPANPLAHALMGDIYADQERYGEAIQWYRMALDLKPGESTRKKLEEAERQRIRHPDRESAAPSLPTGSQSTRIGTSKLLGMTPRYWLRGITLLSVLFLALVLVAVAATRPPRRTDATYAAPPMTYVPMGSAGQVNPLPPPGPAISGGASESPPAPEINSMGTGFPSDSITASKPSGDRSAPGDQPAPVRSVMPLGSGSAQPPRTQTPTPSDDGFEVVLADHVAARSEIDLELAPGSGVVASHDTAVRAAFRAARRSFASDTAVTHALILVQAPSGASEPLFYGIIDRLGESEVDPDTDPIDRLESLVRSPDGQAPPPGN